MNRFKLSSVAISLSILMESPAIAANFEVKSIESGATPDSTEPADFDMGVNIEIKKDMPGLWTFGFYMPRTFNALGDINPDLEMYVYDNADPTKKVDLAFIKKDSAYYNIDIPGYGDGYNNVFRPTKRFNLKAGHTYTFEFKRNNQWSPDNISAMPQNFYFIDALGDLDTYEAGVDVYADKNNVQDMKSITGYNLADTNAAIQTKLSSYVVNSMAAQNTFAEQYNLVPTPVNASGDTSNMQIVELTNGISAPSGANKNVEFLREYLKKDGIITDAGNLPSTDVNSASIIFTQDSSITSPEGYLLTVDNNKVQIRYRTNAGLFYGIQTLRNLYQKDNVVTTFQVNKLKLPEATINDFPRFEYRGVLIDTARHFFDIATIKTMIDAMAAQKLNTLHIHFSDDEGFRLGLDSVDNSKADNRGIFISSVLPPQMYQQANLDKSNYYNQVPTNNIEDLIYTIYPNAATMYSGTYSKAQLKEIIDYANSHQITVIPEIDLPGHAKALVDSDPETFIDPNDKSKYISVQGYYDDVIPVCLYNQSTTQATRFTNTINLIIKEISNIFDNQSTVYFSNEVSVGGDEVAHGAWTNDSSCEAQKSLSALEKSHKFFDELQKGTSIKLSGWQQAVQNDPVNGQAGGIGKYSMRSDQTGHIWVWNTFIEKWSKDTPEGYAPGAGLSEAEQLANAGYKTVLAYSSDTYFDLTYTPNAWEPGLYWATQYSDTHAALNSALDSKITVDDLADNKKQNIAGLEATLWSENINNANHLYYMAFPKMAGLAEAAWSDEAVTVYAPQSPSMARENYYSYKIDWNSLVDRLGTNNDKYLGYIAKIINPSDDTDVVPYRGYPNGISDELPA